VLEKTPHRLSNELIIKIAVDIASGMQCLHKHRIIHRDLKADNIMVFPPFSFSPFSLQRVSRGMR